MPLPYIGVLGYVGTLEGALHYHAPLRNSLCLLLLCPVLQWQLMRNALRSLKNVPVQEDNGLGYQEGTSTRGLNQRHRMCDTVSVSPSDNMKPSS